jgi:hypothetical protein
MFVLLDVIEQLTTGNFIIFAIKMKNKRNLIYEDCSCCVRGIDQDCK